MQRFQKQDTPRRRGGFTLVEVMITLTVVSVAVYLMSSTITATMVHSSARKERTLAVETAMNVLERMRAVPFDELYALYNSDPSDDPDGNNSAPGPHFDVPGLHPIDGQPAIGTIVMPQLEGQLRENINIPELGLPRDLNGDLIVDGFDHSDDYKVLPIEVRVEWKGNSGKGLLVMSSMFSSVQKQL